MIDEPRPENIDDDDLDAVQGAAVTLNARSMSSKADTGSAPATVPSECKIPGPPGPFAAAPYPDAIDSFDTVSQKSGQASKTDPGTRLTKGI